ncbi:MAG: hypothetical protein GXO68_03775, partial [Crenarchaeota archaeon]|nr:hypothetical protein [Thermoproteota archaeon]
MGEERLETQIDEKTLLKKAEELRDKIVEVKTQRRQLIDEVRSLREQRRKLIEEKRVLLDELKKLRAERKKLIEELEGLKKERNSVAEELKQKREQLKLAKQIAEKEGNVARISLRKLQRRLEELEWRQMTSVLPPEEERRLIERIERLEE